MSRTQEGKGESQPIALATQKKWGKFFYCFIGPFRESRRERTVGVWTEDVLGDGREGVQWA